MFDCKPIRILWGMISIAACLLIFKGYAYVSATPNILAFISNVTVPKPDVEQRNFTCGKKEVFSVVMECRPCSRHEMKMFENTCKSSGNIEKVKCDSSKDTILPCPIAFKHEIKKFWIFEGVLITVGLISNVAVWWRRRALDAHFYQRIKRQISDCNM